MFLLPIIPTLLLPSFGLISDCFGLTISTIKGYNKYDIPEPEVLDSPFEIRCNFRSDGMAGVSNEEQTITLMIVLVCTWRDPGLVIVYNQSDPKEIIKVNPQLLE